MSDRLEFSCRQITELVTEYFEGGPDPAQRLAFERHVAICPPCRGYLGQMRRIVAAAGAVGPEHVPDALRQSLVEAFRDWHEGEQA